MQTVMARLWGRAKRNRSPSWPTMLVAAVATLMDWGEIILPVTPPEELEATASSGYMPTTSAVLRCMPQNRALEEVSEPVRNTPSQPSRGANSGKKPPVRVKAIPRVELMPE